MVSATEDASPTGWGGGEIVCDAAASGICVITEILEGRTGWIVRIFVIRWIFL